MKYFILLFCGSLISLCVSAQVFDDFNDGDLDFPPWLGDDSLFAINGGQLQLNAATAKDAGLALSSPLTLPAEWRFWIRNAFSPSTANFSRFYLMSDHQNLKGDLNGYYIQVGGSTGNTDSVTLWKQKGNIRTRIIAGRPATVSRSNNILRVRVLRDSLGVWSFWTDTTGQTNYVLEGSIIDTQFTSSSYCGYFCRFTSGNIHNFYLDDVYIGQEIIDTFPPHLDSVRVTGINQLRLVFSEPIDQFAAEDVLHYTLSGAMGNPVSAVLQNGNVVLLNFFGAFTSGSNYMITVASIPDYNGNKLVEQQVAFGYYIPVKEDILITELMPDPSPPLGLPEAEYIELFNRCPHPVNLLNWTISDGTTTSSFPDFIIPPDSFVIVCGTANAFLFTSFGRLISLPSLPSLNNTADKLMLKNAYGTVIHEIAYDLSWYKDKEKESGGWSLEMKNPYDLCKAKNNYSASASTDGGTPGKQNSSWTLQPDTDLPELKTLVALSDTVLLLVFNEKMDSLSLYSATIILSNGIILNRTIGGSSEHDSLFLLVTHLLPNVSHSLKITGPRDCNMNSIRETVSVFTWYVADTPAQSDVLITEIMADPDPVNQLPSAEYIEIFNKSDKVIQLNNWVLRDATSSARLPSFFLLPDSFLVITSLAHKDLFPSELNWTYVSGFPSLGNDNDEISLVDPDGNNIHKVSYSNTFYHDKIKSQGGWSIEMIDVNDPCGSSGNWRASDNQAGGTPGKPNSVKGRHPDRIPPCLLRAYPLSDSTIRLTFDEPMETSGLREAGHYLLNKGPFPWSAAPLNNSLSAALVTFAGHLDSGTIYRIIVSGIRDCSGNLVAESDYADFGLPHPPAKNDLCINEILFDPASGGADFVEILNRSNRIIDLKNIFIANTDDADHINEFYPVDTNGLLMFPGVYFVLTADPSLIRESYFTPDPQNLVACKMPSFNDDKGSCVLLSLPLTRYDQFNYDDKMHYPLLDTKDGVSLERIDPGVLAGERTNWTSASATSGFATPTYRNSQYYLRNDPAETLHIEPEVFSPDNDGYNDMLHFTYRNDHPGYTANLMIFDASGLQVCHLLKNVLLGTEGSFNWNGIMDDGKKATLGIYTVLFEIFDLSGNVKQQRKAIVVGGRL